MEQASLSFMCDPCGSIIDIDLSVFEHAFIRCSTCNELNTVDRVFLVALINYLQEGKQDGDRTM